MSAPVPAGALLHPLALAALGLLVMNDHWWKDQFGSMWTGKLSDVAGLILFPLVLQGLVEFGAVICRKPWRPSFLLIWVASLLTGIGFAALQVSPLAGQVYVEVSTAIQAPFWAFLGLPPIAGHLTPDISDLLTLPALLVPVWIHFQR